MHKVLITGAGKIGSLIACLFLDSNDYEVIIADLDFAGADIKRVKNRFPHLKMIPLDVRDKKSFAEILSNHEVSAIISSLPFFANQYVAEMAAELKLHYFDLTEDIHVTEAIKKIAKKSKSAFVPQCGLAPGFIGIAAFDLMKYFTKINEIKLRVGALPQFSNNALHYALTWSTDGLINEYDNECPAIKNGQKVFLEPLQDLEIIEINGVDYEAFNTSGGIGGLADLCLGKVNALTYKTIRYLGHCEKMQFLLHDLKLAQNRELLKNILEFAIPTIDQDFVLICVAVNGESEGEFFEKSYITKVLPQVIAGLSWSAIQVTTAAEICAVVDLVLQNPKKYHGFIWQDKFLLDEILENQFGKYYGKF